MASAGGGRKREVARDSRSVGVREGVSWQGEEEEHRTCVVIATTAYRGTCDSLSGGTGIPGRGPEESLRVSTR